MRRSQGVEDPGERASNRSARLRVYFGRYFKVPGWFRWEAAVLWDCLLDFQRQKEMGGGLLEIGVAEGRTAALLALHANEGEDCVFVDCRPVERAEAMIRRIRPHGCSFLRARSDELSPGELQARFPRRFRWLHIDGEHSGKAVRHDLGLATALLAEEGVVVVDDFFSSKYPQVTEAVFRFVFEHADELSPFLCGFNKTYLCRPAHVGAYLRFIQDQLPQDMMARGCRDFTLYKTTAPDDMNCFGIGPYQGYMFRGPDWDERTIEI